MPNTRRNPDEENDYKLNSVWFFLDLKAAVISNWLTCAIGRDKMSTN